MPPSMQALRRTVAGVAILATSLAMGYPRAGEAIPDHDH